MRLQNSILVIGLTAASFGLSGCLDVTKSAAPVIDVSNANAHHVLLVTPAKAQAYGGQSTVLNETNAVATYSGPPRNFITCVAPTQASADTAATGLVLDARSTMRVDGDRIHTDTMYIATYTPSSERVSVQFSDRSTGSFGNGVSCRSTGSMERRTFGLE